MNGVFSTLRLRLIGIIFCLYYFPICVFSAYSVSIMPIKESWHLFWLGILLASLGVFVFFFLFYVWQKKIITQGIDVQFLETFTNKNPQEKEKESLLMLEEGNKSYIQDLHHLRNKLELLQEEKKRLEESNEDHKGQIKIILESLTKEKELVKNTLEKMQSQSKDLIVKEKKIEELEKDIRDKEYEIKTLLQLSHEEKKEHTLVEEDVFTEEKRTNYDQKERVDDNMMYLTRCIDIAQKMTGANRFVKRNYLHGNNSLSENDLVLDFRRLFDALGGEQNCTVIVFSSKENKILFINDQIKKVLGWSKEKFITDFFELIEEGIEEWNMVMRNISIHKTSSVRMLFQSSDNQSQLVQFQLKMIPSGLFRGYIIGIMSHV